MGTRPGTGQNMMLITKKLPEYPYRRRQINKGYIKIGAIPDFHGGLHREITVSLHDTGHNARNVIELHDIILRFLRAKGYGIVSRH